MPKQAKGFSLNLGPVKKELLDFAQGFGVLTTQLGTFMQTMGQVQRASQGFGANPLFGQVMNTPNQGTGYQTPVGMQAQAAAQQAGWTQQPSYQERFNNLYGAARSQTPIHELALNQADQAIVEQSRAAVRQATETVQDIHRGRNSVSIRQNQDVAAGAAQVPIVRALVDDMRQSGMSPAQAALEIKRLGPEASSTLSSLGGPGFMRQARMLAEKPQQDLEADVAKQRAISQARHAARAMPDQTAMQADREAKLEDIRLQNLKQGFNVSFQVGQQARSAMTRAAVTGDQSYKYGLGDVVEAKGILKNHSQDDAIKQFTDKLKSSTDALDRGLGGELEKMGGQFESLAKRFTGLNDELQKQTVGSDRYNKILAELARTGGQLVQVDKDRKEASEQGGGPGGGGESGGGPTMRQRMARGFQTFQAVAGVGLGVAELGFGVYNNMQRQNLGSERRMLSSEAELSQLSFQRKLASNDMTSVENRLKYRGDIMLSPAQLQGSYLGQQGQGKAIETALKETLGTLKQEDRETMQKLITGGLRMGLGMTAAVGGALTSETGLGLMAGAAGVHQMVGGAQQISGAYNTESQNLQKGGVAGTWFGRMLGGTDEMVDQNKREALMGVSLTVAKRVEELQNNDLARFAEMKYGMEGREAARQTKIEGAALVGPYSVSGMEGAQSSIEAAMAEGEKSKTTSLEDSTRAFRRVSELTHGQAVGGIDRYAGEKVGGVAKDAMMFAMQGLESSFGKYTDNGVNNAAGAYQMLGVVGLKGYEYAKQKNPGLTREQFNTDTYAQTDAMSKILDDYNPNFFKKAAPGISDAAALLIEHKQGQNATGAAAARAYMRGESYKDVNGANVTDYVREGVATYEIQKRRLELKRLGQGDLNENQMAQMGASMMGAPMAMSMAQSAIDERKEQLRREIEDRTQQLGANIAGANSGPEYMNRQLLASRKSDEAVDKYFNSREDIALDPASRFGMSYAEFGKHQNIVSNFVGTDSQGRGRAGAAMTSELIGMSRGGLGSFESLMGNLQGLNQARGGQNNMDALRETMASAVTAGFDKSRTAQQFVTSVTTLAQSLDVTSTQDLSERMAAGSLMMGATPGQGDERSMMLAQRGIQQADRFTGQTSGYVGANKLNALVEAGATMGNGLGILQKMNYSQTSAGIRELSNAKSLSDIKQEDVRALVGQYGSFEEGKKKVEAQLRAAAQSERASAFTSMRIFGKDPEKELDALRKMAPADRIKEAGRIINEAYVQGSGTTLGSSGAAMMAIDKLREQGLITGRDADKYQRRYDAGVSTATDVAKQEQARFGNRASDRSGAAVTTATSDQLKGFFGENGVLRNQAGGTVTAEQYKKIEAGDQAFLATPEGKRAAAQVKSATTDDLGLGRRGKAPGDGGAGDVEKAGQFLGPEAAKALGSAIGGALATGEFGSTMKSLTQAIQQLNGKIGSMGTKGIN